MSTTTEVSAGLVKVNNAEIYHEIRGSGPALVFVPGTTGDAGHFTRVSELLSDEFTVVAYDRRGNSRSPQPDGWANTSTDEQADDLCGLIEALALGQTLVYGTSGGAIIALSAILRCEKALSGAILHEPPLVSVVEHPEEMMGVIQPIIEAGMARGGPRGGLEAFLDFAAGEALKSLDPKTLERMLGNADVFFGLEFGTFESWLPDDRALRSVKIPVQVMAGSQSAPMFREASEWVAQRFGTELVTAPGSHAPSFDRPGELAEAIRPFLRRLS